MRHDRNSSGITSFSVAPPASLLPHRPGFDPRSAATEADGSTRAHGRHHAITAGSCDSFPGSTVAVTWCRMHLPTLWHAIECIQQHKQVPSLPHASNLNSMLTIPARHSSVHRVQSWWHDSKVLDIFLVVITLSLLLLLKHTIDSNYMILDDIIVYYCNSSPVLHRRTSSVLLSIP